MGGKKKLSISQAEKAQRRAMREEARRARAREQTRAERKFGGIIPPNPKDEKVMNEIRKMRVLTPYTVASRFNIRLSVAKNLLRELHRQGVITHVSSGVNTEIYTPR